MSIQARARCELTLARRRPAAARIARPSGLCRAARRCAALERGYRSGARCAGGRRQAADVAPWAAFRQEYIDAHGISKTVEEVINATVKAKASEPCSFMVRRRRLTGQPRECC